jgi:hypothetical protein
MLSDLSSNVWHEQDNDKDYLKVDNKAHIDKSTFTHIQTGQIGRANIVGLPMRTVFPGNNNNELFNSILLPCSVSHDTVLHCLRLLIEQITLEINVLTERMRLQDTTVLIKKVMYIALL